MKAREQLNWLLESGGWNVDDSAAALRELDGLLSSMVEEANRDELIDCDFVRSWLIRAAQAGYGEK